jgi:hypothetical protein
LQRVSLPRARLDESVNRLETLTALHRTVNPRSYLQIGVGDGRDLAAATCRTIGVDPALQAGVEASGDVQLLEMTSQAFFAQADPLGWFDTGDVDLSFITGHIFERTLRDFIAVERLSSPGGVIVIDNMLPRAAGEASRDRHSNIWAGDVFKLAAVLETYRPDLVVIRIDTAPSGMVLVAGLDPTSQVLGEKQNQIVTDFVAADPQVVPRPILRRRSAADPARVLAASMWPDLVAARNSGEALPANLSALLELRGTARYVPDPAVMVRRRAKKTTATPRPAPTPQPAARSARRRTMRRVRQAIKRRLP